MLGAITIVKFWVLNRKTYLGIRFPPVYSQALRGYRDGEVYKGESAGADGEISYGKVNFSIRHHIDYNWTTFDVTDVE